MTPTVPAAPDLASSPDATVGIVPPVTPNRGERQACRIPVLPDHQPCQLKIGDKFVPAALINESKTGLAVLTDRVDGLAAGTKADLLTDTETVPIEIVYIEKVAPCAYSATKCDTLFQLGVKKTPNPALS
jgi:hypothetical protein